MSCPPEDQKQTNSQSGWAGEALDNGMTSYVAHMDTVLKWQRGQKLPCEGQAFESSLL